MKTDTSKFKVWSIVPFSHKGQRRLMIEMSTRRSRVNGWLNRMIHRSILGLTTHYPPDRYVFMNGHWMRLAEGRWRFIPREAEHFLFVTATEFAANFDADDEGFDAWCDRKESA